MKLGGHHGQIILRRAFVFGAYGVLTTDIHEDTPRFGFGNAGEVHVGLDPGRLVNFAVFGAEAHLSATRINHRGANGSPRFL